MIGRRDAALARVVLALSVVYAAALLWSRRSYIPEWDGRIYADCIVRAAMSAFTPGALRCADHASHGYMAIASLVQRLRPGSYPLILATNAALLALSAAAFARIARRIVPNADAAAERALVTAAFVVHPVVLANVVQPSIDLGVMAFMLWATAAAVSGNTWAMVGAGLLASFSKETGAVLYALLVAVYVVTRVLPRPMPRAVRTAMLGFVVGLIAGPTLVQAAPWGLLIGVVLGAVAFAALLPRPLPAEWHPRELRRRLVPVAHLVLPGVAFAAYLAYRATHATATRVLWGNESSQSLLQSLLVAQFGVVSRNYFALIFVLGFMWVPTLVLLADAAVGARHIVRERPRRAVPGMDADRVLLLALLAVGTVYLVTRYRTFASPRYLLPAYPLLLLLLLPSLRRLGVRSLARQGFLGVVVGLFALQAVRTADPVSRALWGTFPVGRHELLRTTSLTHECCGHGRDQLVYNLQFTAIDALQNRALERIQPVARRRTVSVSWLATWYLIGPMDGASRRTLVPAAGDSTKMLLPEFLTVTPPGDATLPDSTWFLALPYIDERGPLANLRLYYEPGRPDTVRVGGYAMAVWPFVRRRGGAAAGAPLVLRPPPGEWRAVVPTVPADGH